MTEKPSHGRGLTILLIPTLERRRSLARYSRAWYRYVFHGAKVHRYEKYGLPSAKGRLFNLQNLMVFGKVLSMSLNQFIYHFSDGVNVKLASGMRVKHCCLVDVLKLFGTCGLYR